jgi:hypothetical protein
VILTVFDLVVGDDNGREEQPEVASSFGCQCRRDEVGEDSYFPGDPICGSGVAVELIVADIFAMRLLMGERVEGLKDISVVIVKFIGTGCDDQPPQDKDEQQVSHCRIAMKQP